MALFACASPYQFEKDGKYFIVESKFGCSNLSNCAYDIRQMDSDWIRDRLRKSNLPEATKTAILMNYTPVLSKISKTGVVTYKKLNASGYIDTSAKTFEDIFGG